MYDLGVGVFLYNWQIGRSDEVQGKIQGKTLNRPLTVWEPAYHTTEWGLQISSIF